MGELWGWWENYGADGRSVGLMGELWGWWEN